MTNFKKYLMVATMGLLGSALVGCTKTETVYIDELYQKAYITTDIYPQSKGEYVRTDVMKSASLYFDSSSNLVVTEGGLVSSESGRKNYEMFFRTVYNVKSDLTGTLTVRSDAAEFVENYNAENGYIGDNACQLLGSEFYNIVNGKSTIAAGFNEGDEKFAVELAEDLSALAPGNYILPLTCTLSDPNIEMSESMGTFCLAFSYSYSDERIEGQEDELTERLLTYNTDFTASLTTGRNYSIGSSYGNNVASLFDGKPTTGQLCSASSYYVDYTITFTSPVKLTRVGYVNFALNSIGWGYSYAPGSVCYQFTDADGGSETWSDWYACPRSEDNYFDIIEHDKPITKLIIEFYGYNYMGADEICLLASTVE